MRSIRRESVFFALTLAALLAAWFSESLFMDKILSPADVLRAQKSFQKNNENYQPFNRLLMDPVLQFEPWLEFNRTMLRRGRLPLWNDRVGLGAPHLANGQSAVFDPIHLIAYVGKLPQARAWMAAVRLWLAGLGAFLLAKAWRFRRWGSWFAGLALPFCGFNTVWLLYPVASASIWLPWTLLASERAVIRPNPSRLAFLAIVVACSILAGHIQTSAHILILAGIYVLWRLGPRGVFGRRGRGWTAGICVGIALAAIEIAPLAGYLARSPVWIDRAVEKHSPWTIVRPRFLDAACMATPYVYGSQRRGQPNLARALGVHNLNESAGGFAGLVTLIWLAPLGIAARRRRKIARFLTVALAIGACGAFDVPPVANLLRAIPVLDVIDQRRLTLWVAFCLVFLGAIGIDRMTDSPRSRFWKVWIAVWLSASVAFAIVAGFFSQFEPTLRAKAAAHVSKMTVNADPNGAGRKIDEHVDLALQFVPRYFGYLALQLFLLSCCAIVWRRGKLKRHWVESFAFGMAVLDLGAFGFGLNPAIDPSEYRPASEVIAYLKREVPPPARIVAVGAELPPNTLSRFGLADLRNYDSIESTRTIHYLDPLFETESGRKERTSRRSITWSSVLRARYRLETVGVRAIVGATPPPAGEFDRVDRVGRVFIARLNSPLSNVRFDDGEIEFECSGTAKSLVIPVVFDPGWRGEAEDGRQAAIGTSGETFLSVQIPPGAQRLKLFYDPIEVRIGVLISAAAACVVGGWLARSLFFSRKIGSRAWIGLKSRGRIQSVNFRHFEPVHH